MMPDAVQMRLAEPLKLKCQVQHYFWGRHFPESLIPKLIGCTSADNTLPFAELWIGAHRSAPAFVELPERNVGLDQLIHEHANEILGDAVFKRYGADLPFMLKVLSIGHPLSIQAHPDRTSAAMLHAKDPEHYPDANHKPELAIAISVVNMLHSFRPITEVQGAVRGVEELASLLSADTKRKLQAEDTDTSMLASVYREVMTKDEAVIGLACKHLYQRLENKSNRSREEEWVMRLAPGFADGNAGIFSFFLLNLLTLQPGEGMFTGPNILHQYLDGELIECMSNSDNVIRGGLTKKRTDAATLLTMLDYQHTQPLLVAGQEIRSKQCKRYYVPVEEFQLDRFDGAVKKRQCSTGKSVQLIFCLQGKGSISVKNKSFPLAQGDAYLIPALVARYEFALDEGTVFCVSVPA
jgi:mannose-6-phosphate isomerase